MSKDIQVSSLMQKKQHHDVIQILQQDLDRQEKVSSFQLYLLAGAYYEIRDYEKTLKTVDLMERQIALGDAGYFGSDLTLFPGILRGYVYLDQGEYAKAAKAATAAYGLLHRPGAGSNTFYRAQLIDVESILGVSYACLNQNEQAQNCIGVLQKINTSASNLGPEKFIAIAKIYIALKQYKQALASIQDPEANVSALLTVLYDQTFQELPKYFILAKCSYETGRIAEARERYDQLLRHPQIRQIGGLYWPVLLDRAKIARADGQHQAAEMFLKEAVDVIEKQRSSIQSETGRIGYVGNKQAVYQELITLLIAGNRPAEAFEYVERAKGRALVDLLASHKGFVTHTLDAEHTRTMLSELAKAERELEKIGTPAASGEQDRKRGIVVALKKDLAAQAPEFTSLVSVVGMPAKEIQDLLEEDETLIEYYAGNRDWFVFVMQRDAIAVRQLGPLDLDRKVLEFRTALNDPSSHDYLRHSQALHENLISPISDLLRTGRVTIVPHGPLHYLPFGALARGNTYLVDRAAIRVLQTSSVLKFLASRNIEKNPAILIVGNPDLGDPKYDLKYAQDEAKAIAGIMPGATLLLRERAKASIILKNASSFRIIHLAAHGIFDPENPLDSSLFMAGDGSNDGRLRAGDLYNLNLRADLVTLSACETALGKITQGDDVVGFTRGFLYAGAGSIISTLWRVDDQATKDLMLEFYSKLATMDKCEALRYAQLQTRKKYSHPFYWASFQLTGNAR